MAGEGTFGIQRWLRLWELRAGFYAECCGGEHRLCADPSYLTYEFCELCALLFPHLKSGDHNTYVIGSLYGLNGYKCTYSTQSRH